MISHIIQELFHSNSVQYEKAREETTHNQYSSRSRAEDVTVTNFIIKTPDRKYDWGANDVMLGSDGLGILGILKNSI